ncbi:putative sulfate exporter family transporter [Neorhizobium sp. JUb45]|uniref:YeiH family protein n=1 Tax=unclassified Neorhizobium TaxID=2629175 RepID=UPI001045AB27|nr:putative sulfate exporter family transporter [Neorhizobium sp. JUb45]TCR06154.1 putative integral membrane protein (TIGR00698 family) [Neorhizobium sp. JUb45]
MALATHTDHSMPHALTRLLPGVLATLAVSAVAIALEAAEIQFLQGRWIESLVLAILVGMAVRSCFDLSPSLDAGIQFCAKTVLEVAVVLLGASISISAIEDAGLTLVVAIMVIVALSLIGSYGIGRLVGLSPRIATLVACGNSICGNSAIAAAAPVIHAKPDEIASSIAFTAVLGVALVLALPLLQMPLSLGVADYGVFAGLTVYAVPQVLAATAPAGLISVQTGTLVKLIRVMMLGPVIATLSVLHGRNTGGKLCWKSMVPWFILGFAALMALRSADMIPQAALAPTSATSGLLTIVSMAALGLSVDIRSIRQSGARVIGAAMLSLAFLSGLALIFLKVFGGH